MELVDGKKLLNAGPSPRGWHRLQLAAECLQRYAWTYESPDEKAKFSSPALAKGSLIHLALAQHYARMRAAQAPKSTMLGVETESPDDWMTPQDAVWLVAKAEGQEAYAQLAIDAYEAYQAFYADDMEEWKILEVEQLMSTKIAGKYLLTGRLDLVIEDVGGRVWGIDHKTGGRITKQHKEYYGISGQLIGYEHMAREKYGDRLAGFMVNFIQHGQAPEFKFSRIEIARRPHLEGHFVQSVVDIEESIERMQASGREYDAWPKAMSELVCFHRYGPCAHVDKCRWGKGAKKAGNWTWVGL